jgi:hypothetical protein
LQWIVSIHWNSSKASAFYMPIFSLCDLRHCFVCPSAPSGRFLINWIQWVSRKNDALFFMSWQYYLDLDPWAPFDFGGLELNRLARTAAVSAAISATMTFARNRALGNGHRHGIPSRQIGKVSNPKSPNCLQEKRRIEVATCCCLNIFKIQMRLQSEISPFLG